MTRMILSVYLSLHSVDSIAKVSSSNSSPKMLLWLSSFLV